MRTDTPNLTALLVAMLSICMCSACKRPSSSPPAKSTLTILAAASLADTFRELGAAFEASHPDSKLSFSFAGSNQLRTQLENGAPGDLFASADRGQMEAAIVAGCVDSSTIHLFAHNRLALLVPIENRAGIKTLADLAQPALKIVVADKAVPAGNYTRLMLDKAAATPDLGKKFVSAFDANTVSREENVAAVVAKIALNEADAGIAYATDAARAYAAKLTMLTIPPELDQQTDDVIAVTARTSNPVLARQFVEFLSSDSAKATLRAKGFVLPGAAAP